MMKLCCCDKEGGCRKIFFLGGEGGGVYGLS